MQKGQGGVEYLLLIGGGVLVATIVITLTLGVIDSASENPQTGITSITELIEQRRAEDSLGSGSSLPLAAFSGIQNPPGAVWQLDAGSYNPETGEVILVISGNPSQTFNVTIYSEPINVTINRDSNCEEISPDLWECSVVLSESEVNELNSDPGSHTILVGGPLSPSATANIEIEDQGQKDTDSIPQTDTCGYGFCSYNPDAACTPDCASAVGSAAFEIVENTMYDHGYVWDGSTFIGLYFMGVDSALSSSPYENYLLGLTDSVINFYYFEQGGAGDIVYLMDYLETHGFGTELEFVEVSNGTLITADGLKGYQLFLVCNSEFILVANFLDPTYQESPPELDMMAQTFNDVLDRLDCSTVATETITCNNNNICEAGENPTNCPADCEAGEPVNIETITSEAVILEPIYDGFSYSPYTVQNNMGITIFADPWEKLDQETFAAIGMKMRGRPAGAEEFTPGDLQALHLTEHRSFYDFDTTIIPNNAQITDVKLNLYVENSQENPEITLLKLSERSQQSSTSEEIRTLWNDMAGCHRVNPERTAFINDCYQENVTLVQQGEQIFDLGLEGEQDLQGLLNQDYFPIGLTVRNMYQGGETLWMFANLTTTESTSNNPTLEVSYETIQTLSCEQFNSLTVGDNVWTSSGLRLQFTDIGESTATIDLIYNETETGEPRNGETIGLDTGNNFATSNSGLTEITLTSHNGSNIDLCINSAETTSTETTISSNGDLLELYDYRIYPYDSSHTGSKPYIATITTGTSDPNSLYYYKISNSAEIWDDPDGGQLDLGPLSPTRAGQILNPDFEGNPGIYQRPANFLETVPNGTPGKDFVNVEFLGFEDDEEKTIVEIGQQVNGLDSSAHGGIEFRADDDSLKQIPFYIKLDNLQTNNTFDFDSTIWTGVDFGSQGQTGEFDVEMVIGNFDYVNNRLWKIEIFETPTTYVDITVQTGQIEYFSNLNGGDFTVNGVNYRITNIDPVSNEITVAVDMAVEIRKYDFLGLLLFNTQGDVIDDTYGKLLLSNNQVFDPDLPIAIPKSIPLYDDDLIRPAYYVAKYNSTNNSLWFLLDRQVFMENQGGVIQNNHWFHFDGTSIPSQSGHFDYLTYYHPKDSDFNSTRHPESIYTGIFRVGFAPLVEDPQVFLTKVNTENGGVNPPATYTYSFENSAVRYPGTPTWKLGDYSVDSTTLTSGYTNSGAKAEIVNSGEGVKLTLPERRENVEIAVYQENAQIGSADSKIFSLPMTSRIGQSEIIAALNGVDDVNALTNADLPLLLNLQMPFPSGTVTVKEVIGLDFDARFDRSSDTKDLVGKIDHTGDFAYEARLGSSTTGVPAQDVIGSYAPLFGTLHKVTDLQLTGNRSITFDTSQVRLNEGMYLRNLDGAGALAGQKVKLRLVSIVDIAEVTPIYAATFELYDESNNFISMVAGIPENAEISEYFSDLATPIVVDTTAIGATSGIGYVELTVG